MELVRCIPAYSSHMGEEQRLKYGLVSRRTGSRLPAREHSGYVPKPHVSCGVASGHISYAEGGCVGQAPVANS